jgi:hypothetical protein
LKIQRSILNEGTGVREIRVVQQVENIHTKLKLRSLSNREESTERQIHLGESKSSDVVATLCPVALYSESKNWDLAASAGAAGFSSQIG